MEFDYSHSLYPIPEYKAAAHRGAWAYMAAPGSWWTGRERVAIAEASRAAFECPLCTERKAALSPNAVTGIHPGSSILSDKVVDAVHRITTDSARTSILNDCFY